MSNAEDGNYERRVSKLEERCSYFPFSPFFALRVAAYNQPTLIYNQLKGLPLDSS